MVSCNKRGGEGRSTQMWIACSVRFPSMFVESCYEFLPQGPHTIITIAILMPYNVCMKKYVAEGTEKWNMRNQFLHHDNTSAHRFVPAEISGYKQNDRHSTSSLLITSGTMRLPSFPTTQALKGRRLNDTNTVQAKLWDALAEFQNTHFTQFFEQWHDRGAHEIKSYGDCFEGDSIDWRRVLPSCGNIEPKNYLITLCESA